MSVYDWLKITMDHAMGVDWPMGNVHVTGDTSYGRSGGGQRDKSMISA